MHSTPANRAALILPADHEFWRDHFSSSDFNCRCTITAIDEIPAGYDHNTPSGEAEIHYDGRGNPGRRRSARLLSTSRSVASAAERG